MSKMIKNVKKIKKKIISDKNIAILENKDNIYNN